MWGIGKKGGRDAYVRVADSIKIGELEFQNCPIEVMESRSVAGDEGLIGADVFEDFLVDIDFPNKKLKLSQLPARPGELEADVRLKSEDDESHDDADDRNENKSDEEKSSDAKSDAKPANAKSGAATPVGLRDAYIAPEMKNYSRVFRFGHDLLIPTSIGQVPQKLFLIDHQLHFAPGGARSHQNFRRLRHRRRRHQRARRQSLQRQQSHTRLRPPQTGKPGDDSL